MAVLRSSFIIHTVRITTKSSSGVAPPLRVGAYRLRVHPANVTAHSASGVCIIGDGA